MPSIAVTGSIGSGKSLVSELLARRIPCTTFSADMENRRLLESDSSVKGEIIALLGDQAYGGKDRPDRGWIRSRITSDASLRKGLEDILHPRIRNAWEPKARECKAPSSETFLAEIPLLFEKGLDEAFDRVVVVGCSEAVRRERLASLRGISEKTAAEWTSLQMPQEEKILLGDHLVWNDGTRACLESQTERLASLILS